MKTAFLPVIDQSARILILGSMPGEASLEADQYYAFPRNAFWQIMTTLLGLPAGLSYQQRLEALIDNGIALWDVIAQCERQGSLDSAIRHESVTANDFEQLLANHPGIKNIVFNGKSANSLFKRHVQRAQQIPDYIDFYVLPSTSPANASISAEHKLEAWKSIPGIYKP